jgi:hypothetical protein
MNILATGAVAAASAGSEADFIGDSVDRSDISGQLFGEGGLEADDQKGQDNKRAQHD